MAAKGSGHILAATEVFQYLITGMALLSINQSWKMVDELHWGGGDVYPVIPKGHSIGKARGNQMISKVHFLLAFNRFYVRWSSSHEVLQQWAGSTMPPL